MICINFQPEQRPHTLKTRSLHVRAGPGFQVEGFRTRTSFKGGDELRPRQPVKKGQTCRGQRFLAGEAETLSRDPILRASSVKSAMRFEFLRSSGVSQVRLVSSRLSLGAGPDNVV